MPVPRERRYSSGCLLAGIVLRGHSHQYRGHRGLQLREPYLPILANSNERARQRDGGSQLAAIGLVPRGRSLKNAVHGSAFANELKHVKALRASLNGEQVIPEQREKRQRHRGRKTY
jgi:hypothetical protein